MFFSTVIHPKKPPSVQQKSFLVPKHTNVSYLVKLNFNLLQQFALNPAVQCTNPHLTPNTPPKCVSPVYLISYVSLVHLTTHVCTVISSTFISNFSRINIQAYKFVRISFALFCITMSKKNKSLISHSCVKLFWWLKLSQKHHSVTRVKKQWLSSVSISRKTTVLFQEKTRSAAIFILILIKPTGFYRGQDSAGLRPVTNTVTFLYQLKSEQVREPLDRRQN